MGIGAERSGESMPARGSALERSISVGSALHRPLAPVKSPFADEQLQDGGVGGSPAAAVDGAAQASAPAGPGPTPRVARRVSRKISQDCKCACWLHSGTCRRQITLVLHAFCRGACNNPRQGNRRHARTC
jgi:hypothetical protein